MWALENIRDRARSLLSLPPPEKVWRLRFLKKFCHYRFPSSFPPSRESDTPSIFSGRFQKNRKSNRGIVRPFPDRLLNVWYTTQSDSAFLKYRDVTFHILFKQNWCPFCRKINVAAISTFVINCLTVFHRFNQMFPKMWFLHRILLEILSRNILFLSMFVDVDKRLKNLSLRMNIIYANKSAKYCVSIKPISLFRRELIPTTIYRVKRFAHPV